jgi:hypothetical protein
MYRLFQLPNDDESPAEPIAVTDTTSVDIEPVAIPVNDESPQNTETQPEAEEHAQG